MKKINCTYARFAAWDGHEPVYECCNQRADSYLKMAKDKVCTLCRERVQLDPYEPPVIDRKPPDRQMTIEEYIRSTA